MTGLLRAELLKLRATRTIRWAMLGTLLVVAASLAVDLVEASRSIEMIRLSKASAEPGAAIDDVYWQAFGVDDSVASLASGLYTSGQYFGLLIALLFGAHLVGGEFSRRTIVTTLLVEPRRHRVLAAKLIAGVSGALLLWAFITAISMPVTVIFLHSEDFGGYLDRPPVIQAILLNAVAYACWTIVGLGLASLLRNLTATVIVALVLYSTSFAATQLLFSSGSKSGQGPGFDPSLLVPSVASHRLVDLSATGGYASPWPGAAVLVGYGLLAGLVGLWLLRRRDV